MIVLPNPVTIGGRAAIIALLAARCSPALTR
jgi:hypothetical protein